MKSKNNMIAVAVLAVLGTAAAQAQTPSTSSEPAGASYAPPQLDAGPPPSTAPQGSSQVRPGEVRFDRVGWAGEAGAGEGVFALSNQLPAGAHAEVTALDSGRTILVVIRGGSDGLADLSSSALTLLGIQRGAPIRVRRIFASAQDAGLLASGQPAMPRVDAPPALLTGLRRQLQALPQHTPSPQAQPLREASVKPAPVPSPKPATPPAAAASKPAAAATGKGLYVQVAALSNLQRARELAGKIGGVVRSAGNIHRVQTGPHANAAAAQRARADLVQRGYGDARVVTVP